MEVMLNDIFTSIDGVTVILSGLLHNANRKVDTRDARLSAEWQSMARRSQFQGQKIVYADTYNDRITRKDLVDGTHPGDLGYQKLAACWLDAIDAAVGHGFIPRASVGSIHSKSMGDVTASLT
jgi:lysophospholipase L1-like esterase